jgi:hypothetical protein
MAIRRWKKYCAVALLAFFLYLSSPTSGCGPFFPQAYFVTSKLPDFPLKPYAAGEVGIVLPSYSRSYLIVAYRYFGGKPLAADEQTAVLKLWNERLSASRDFSDEKPPSSQTWLDERAKVVELAAPGEIQEFKSAPDSYFQYQNCLGDSFATAAATARDRAAKWGTNTPVLVDWVRGQDTVFANCGGLPPVNIPGAAPASTPPLLRADRAYQIAAAEFYGGRFEDAENAFRAISNDTESPWRPTAALMVARCEIRFGTLASENAGEAAEHLRAAEKQLRAIEADDSLRKIHPGARRLLDFVEFRIHPVEQLHELAGRIAGPGEGKDFAQSLSDYSALLGEVRGEAAAAPDSRFIQGTLDRKSAEKLPAHQDDLTEWSLNYDDFSPGSFDRAFAEWKRTHSVPWLVASLTKASSQNSDSAVLIAAARKLPLDSPAYLTATFARLRLTAGGEPDAAAEELDRVLENSKLEVPRSSRNLFLGLRMKTAGSLEDFLRYAPRIPSAVNGGFDELEIPSSVDERFGNYEALKKLTAPNPYFDWDSAQVLDRKLPLNVLVKAVESKSLPAALRIEAARAGWTRAVLLHDDSALKFASILAGIDGDLRSGMEDFQKAQGANEQHYAAIWILLRNPGLRPYVVPALLREGVARTDSYRDNWWCGLSATEGQDGGPREIDKANPRPEDPLFSIYPERAVGSPRFLSDGEREKATSELAALRASDTAPNYLAKESLAWAKSRHDDARVPEALYLAVRATRYGCNDEDTSRLSRQAFIFLHENYPEDEFTAKTKYWY